MPVLEDVEVEEYRFADRHVSARAWSIATELCLRHPELRITGVINEERVPLLIAHDERTDLRIQFDLVAWILYLKPDGAPEYIYWDQVFASGLDTVVKRIESGTGLGEPCWGARFPDDYPHVRTYQVISELLRAGVHDSDGWQVRPVTASPHDPDTTDDALLDLFHGRDHLRSDLVEDLERRLDAGATHYAEPVWVLYRALEPVALLNSVTAVGYTRHHIVPLSKMTRRTAVFDLLAATQQNPPIPQDEEGNFSALVARARRNGNVGRHRPRPRARPYADLDPLDD